MDPHEAGRIEARFEVSTGHAITTAAFAQDQIAVTERAGLTLGVRYDHWHTYDAASQAAAGLALVYRLAAPTVLRASVGTSFRTPTVFDLYRDLRLSSGQLLLGNRDIEPERLIAYEISDLDAIDSYGRARRLPRRTSSLDHKAKDAVTAVRLSRFQTTPGSGSVVWVVIPSQTQRMGQGLVRYHLLAGQCRVGCCAECTEHHSKCDAERDAKSDAQAYMVQGRSQRYSETDT